MENIEKLNFLYRNQWNSSVILSNESSFIFVVVIVIVVEFIKTKTKQKKKPILQIKILNNINF